MHIIKKLVYKNLALNKKRSVVTIIGIILSVALLVALSTLVSSFQKSMILFEKSRGGDYHYKVSYVTDEDVDYIKSHRNFVSMYEIGSLGHARLEESKNPDKPYAHVVATDENGFEKGYFKLLEGRFPQNEEEILIPAHLWTNGRVDYKVGDTITLNVGTRVDVGTGDTILDNSGKLSEERLADTVEKTYTIVGKIARPGYNFEYYNAAGYTFLTYSKEPLGNRTAYCRFNMSALRDNYKTFDELLEAGEGTYQVTDNPNLIEYERVWPISDSFKILFIIASVVALIIIFTSVYCIKNSFDISVTEKIRQYGMLSSIGATKRQIRRSVNYEAAILGCIGIPIGVLSGAFACFVLIELCNILLHDSFEADMVFYPSVIAIFIAIFLGVVTIYFSARGSARKASKVSPMEAIRNQREIKVSAREIKTPKFIDKHWGIGGVISYKNIKRNRRKYRTTTVSIIICTVTFIVISYFMSMLLTLASQKTSEEVSNVKMTVEAVQDSTVFKKEIDSLDGYTNYAIEGRQSVFWDNGQWTDRYADYMNVCEFEEEERKEISFARLNDEAFEKYARECGIDDAQGKAIVVNSKWIGYGDMDGKIYQGMTDVYKNEVGSKLKFYEYYMPEEEYDNEDAQLVKGEYELELAGFTDSRPIGFMSYITDNIIVISESTANSLKYNFGNATYVYFEANDADKLQSDLEDMFLNNGNNGTIEIFNFEADRRQTRSLILMLGIFAYGLIVVIALIGITNIINTLGTSVELRSREFATLRSVGMTDSQFNRMIRLESLFTGGKALLIGIPIGLILSYLINQYEAEYDTTIAYEPPIAACVICVVVVMVVIYAIIKSSLSKIMKRNVIETIKNENL